jgi:voltage-gated potassium channel
MSKPLILPALVQLVEATAGRNMTRTAYVAVTAGVLTMVLLTVNPTYEAAHHWVDAIIWVCLGFFVFEWLVRLRHAAMALGAEPKTVWLLAVLWLVKVVPGIPGLRQLRRVLVLESRPLFSFLLILFLGSVAVYFLERVMQPQTFGNVPSALWWAVATLTTTGYGDVVPITTPGRLVAALVMISGLGVFGPWTSILATGFAAEARRDNFLETRESVSKVPFFASLGPAAIADVTLPPRAMIIRKGQQGDCMYFIASGEVEVDLPGKKVRLNERAFFGEMALLGNNLRGANVTTTWVSRLVLDLVDFRLLMARHPDITQAMDAEGKRRELENK